MWEWWLESGSKSLVIFKSFVSTRHMSNRMELMGILPVTVNQLLLLIDSKLSQERQVVGAVKAALGQLFKADVVIVDDMIQTR